MNRSRGSHCERVLISFALIVRCLCRIDAAFVRSSPAAETRSRNEIRAVRGRSKTGRCEVSLFQFRQEAFQDSQGGCFFCFRERKLFTRHPTRLSRNRVDMSVRFEASDSILFIVCLRALSSLRFVNIKL